MRIHKEGYKIILITLVILVTFNLLVSYFIPSLKWSLWILYSFSFFLFVLIIRFFRSPEINIEINEKCVLCPADGKVVAIEEITESEYFNERQKQISIFMSINNVHINRYPISGFVKYRKYHPGEFWFAWRPKSSSENERTSVVIENEDQKSIMIRQIAGGVARRIVCYAQEGDNVRQGAELGFIKFGSRVDLLLPLDVVVNVELYQIVKGGKTILARFL
jgi:phosphatidylserine decarboxylase